MVASPRAPVISAHKGDRSRSRMRRRRRLHTKHVHYATTRPSTTECCRWAQAIGDGRRCAISLLITNFFFVAVVWRHRRSGPQVESVAVSCSPCDLGRPLQVPAAGVLLFGNRLHVSPSSRRRGIDYQAKIDIFLQRIIRSSESRRRE